MSESERVSFTCSGCGRDTTIHVGSETFLPEKRCMKCRGTNRFGRGRAPTVKGQKVGTHQGRRKSDEQRAIKRAASHRNRTRKSGERLKNQTTHHAPCSSYDECSHRKHGK